MKNFIGLGKFSNFYFYILACAFFRIISYLSLHFSISLKKCELMENIYEYFGLILFGFIFSSIYKNKSNIEKDDNFNRTITYNDILIFFFICFIFVVCYDFREIIRTLGFQDLEIWTFGIIFVLLFMHMYFPSNIYKHQFYSMLFIIITDSILLIIASTLKDIKIKENYVNIYEKTDNIWIIATIILAYIFLHFLRAFAQVNAKELIDLKFISIYKIIITFGIFGFIINVIFALFIIMKDTKCYENIKETIYCYASISDYFRNWNNLHNGYNTFLEIILTFIYSLSYFLYMTYSFLIIRYLNPIYILMSDNIYYEFREIFNLIIGKGDTGEGGALTKFFITQISELLEFIGCIIYLEIIELRFCELNKDIKRKISERGEYESVVVERGSNTSKRHSDISND